VKDLHLEGKLDGRVLIVDDEPAILEVHKRTLTRYGAEVVTAIDGQEAWGIFQESDDFNTVVTDIDMPRMNGVNLIKNILSVKPLTQIVIITGVMDGALALYGAKKNVVCLPKPVEPAFVAVAVATSAVRYQDQLWEASLQSATAAKPWDEEEVMDILRKAPWL